MIVLFSAALKLRVRSAGATLTENVGFLETLEATVPVETVEINKTKRYLPQID